MKNINVSYSKGQLINIETNRPVALKEGNTYSIQGDDNSFEHEKAYTLEEKRIVHNNAYLPWTEEDDDKLEELYCERASINILVKVFGRNSGAINSRISKLELREKYD